MTTYLHPEAIVETDWLEAHLDDPALRVFDCTVHLLYDEAPPGKPYKIKSGREDYDRGHIPGADFLDLQGELSDNDSPLSFTLPSAEHFAAAMARHGATHHLVSTLDDLAWLFNLRGSDVSYNPVFLAHALIDAKGATLFIAEGKIDAALRARLVADGVRLAPYAQAAAAVAALPADAVLLVDPRRVTLGLREPVPAAVRVVESINPCTLAKSRKSDADAVHVRAAMEQDGADTDRCVALFDELDIRRTAPRRPDPEGPAVPAAQGLALVAPPGPAVAGPLEAAPAARRLGCGCNTGNASRRPRRRRRPPARRRTGAA